MKMILTDLIKDIPIKTISGNTGIEIKSVADDTRKITPESLFVAIPGRTVDGHDFIEDAIRRGARAIVCEHKLKLERHADITYIRVENSRKTLALLAGNWYQNPVRKLKFIGITGTNGKTTTSEFTHYILNRLGYKTGLISTISAKIGDEKIDTGYHTTSPEPLDLHRYLKIAVDKSCEYVILETTSHALDQFRCYGIEFEVSCITNITPEHLDYHGSMKEYIRAKASIFKQSKHAFLNKDDPSLKSLLDYAPRNVEVIDYRKILIPEDFRNKFPGEYNLQNIALGVGIVKKIATDLSETQIQTIIAELPQIMGRFEYILKNEKGQSVVIDFAHTPDALEKVLKVTRPVTINRLILVFGCAGLRDTQKRRPMGKIAMRLADVVVVTAEDPRTEDLDEINRMIMEGIVSENGKEGIDYFVIKDRQKAINFAIQDLAQTGDLVLITGKGHESSMCFGTDEIPWSDHEAVKEALEINNP